MPPLNDHELKDLVLPRIKRRGALYVRPRAGLTPPLRRYFHFILCVLRDLCGEHVKEVPHGSKSRHF